MFVGYCQGCGHELDYRDGHTLDRPGYCPPCQKSRDIECRLQRAETIIAVLQRALGWGYAIEDGWIWLDRVPEYCGDKHISEEVRSDERKILEGE